MKILAYLFMSFNLLCTSMCGCGNGGEDDCSNYTYENQLCLVSPEQNAFQIGEEVEIAITIPNEIEALNSHTQSTRNFIISEQLANNQFQLTSNDVSNLLIGNTYQIVTGGLNENHQVEFYFNEMLDQYEFKIKIQFQQLGTFKLNDYNYNQFEVYVPNYLNGECYYFIISANSNLENIEFQVN